LAHHYGHFLGQGQLAITVVSAFTQDKSFNQCL
jgi:hypothetical protein